MGWSGFVESKPMEGNIWIERFNNDLLIEKFEFFRLTSLLIRMAIQQYFRFLIQMKLQTQIRREIILPIN